MTSQSVSIINGDINQEIDFDMKEFESKKQEYKRI